MSQDQLKSLFDYARIDFSLSSGTMDTLKHILLRELKSSSDGKMM